MYKYDNVELMDQLSNKYERMIDERKQCGTAYMVERTTPSLEELQQYGIYNKSVHDKFRGRLLENYKKEEANMMMDDLARDTGADKGKLFPREGTPGYNELVKNLRENPLFKSRYDRMISLYPPATAEQVATLSKLHNELIAEYGTTNKEQIREQLKKKNKEEVKEKVREIELNKREKDLEKKIKELVPKEEIEEEPEEEGVQIVEMGEGLKKNRGKKKGGNLATLLCKMEARKHKKPLKKEVIEEVQKAKEEVYEQEEVQGAKIKKIKKLIKKLK